jgi:DNA-binding Xre family transcriptional regulator
MALKDILSQQLRDRRLSGREAATQIGITHTTMRRLLDGGKVELDTLVKVSEWTGISITSLVNIVFPEDSKSVIGDISALVEAEPRLRQVFEQAKQDLDNEIITVDDLRDITAYAAYKLQTAKESKHEARGGSIQKKN